MESRADCASAEVLPKPRERVPAMLATEIARMLRATCIASGCDGRQFITATLHKYFSGPCLTQTSQNSLLGRCHFRITRSDVSHRRPHLRSHLAQLRHSRRPGLPGSDDPASG